MQDHYLILGVRRNATTAEIKSAHRRLLRRLHPDIAGDRPEAIEATAAINVAYETLRDPCQRALYDQALDMHDAAQRQRTGPRWTHHRVIATAAGCTLVASVAGAMSVALWSPRTPVRLDAAPVLTTTRAPPAATVLRDLPETFHGLWAKDAVGCERPEQTVLITARHLADAHGVKDVVFLDAAEPGRVEGFLAGRSAGGGAARFSLTLSPDNGRLTDSSGAAWRRCLPSLDFAKTHARPDERSRVHAAGRHIYVAGPAAAVPTTKAVAPGTLGRVASVELAQLRRPSLGGGEQ
ncbi:J domain-containing protein [Phenylobacterium sp. J426]|uniref:J domain-containing protein n=1 Tax=Phenylobacterium sp. J426 TaxID=2898439 RepID=UPI0021510535|nr:J domain-containing protein [Phenylobacterium sp. J426]MCR5876536.1 J domain-containing protein [Phenylobacterium sp. J426]